MLLCWRVWDFPHTIPQNLSKDVAQFVECRGYLQWSPLESLRVLFYEAKLSFSERSIAILKFHQAIELPTSSLRFLYNRLALIMCYLLDINLGLFNLLLLWEVKWNKSWNTFFPIKVLFYVHDIIQPFATFQYQLH